MAQRGTQIEMAYQKLLQGSDRPQNLATTKPTTSYLNDFLKDEIYTVVIFSWFLGKLVDRISPFVTSLGHLNIFPKDTFLKDTLLTDIFPTEISLRWTFSNGYFSDGHFSEIHFCGNIDLS